MQCNIRKKTHISYEYKKNSPKRYKIVSNLKISLLGDIFNLTSFNISSKLTILQQKVFLIFHFEKHKNHN